MRRRCEVDAYLFSHYLIIYVLNCLSLADINLGLIRYVLDEETVQETMDNFKFLVKDSKPNVVSDNVFHIQWSLISFEHKRLHVFVWSDSGEP